MIRPGWLPLVGVLAVSPLAHGQKKPFDAVETYVLQTVTYAEGCIWMDDLMRRTCARVGRPPPSVAKLCELPARPYRERIAANYAAFRQRFAATIEAMEPDIARVRDRAQRSLDRQFARMIAGEISALDLESLGREVGGNCVTVETQWLSPARWPK